jgi:hypothetical protein
LKVKLPEGNMEPLPPPPLVFSTGVLEAGFDYDIYYQVGYAWNLLPQIVKLRILFSTAQDAQNLDELRNWLMKNVGVEEEAAELVVDPNKREAFLRTKPDAQRVLKYMESELEPWKKILRKNLVNRAPNILAVGTALYCLPKRSHQFVRGAWDRWH